MLTTMRLRIDVEPGARLKFEPDLEREKSIADSMYCWDEYDDHRRDHLNFCRKHYGREATLVELVTEEVWVLDPKHRPFGVYHTNQIKFIFDGEKKIRIGYDRDFVVLSQSVLIDAPEPVRIGDLPEEIQFCPDDTVMVYSARSPRKGVKSLYEKVAYEHKRGKCTVELVERGNIYWLYHDPEKMSFPSSADELRFWWGEQSVSDPLHGLFFEGGGGLMTSDHHKGLVKCKSQFGQDKIDFVVFQQVREHSGSIPTWHGCKLRDVFAQARPRVRAITEQFYLEVAPNRNTHKCVPW